MASGFFLGGGDIASLNIKAFSFIPQSSDLQECLCCTAWYIWANSAVLTLLAWLSQLVINVDNNWFWATWLWSCWCCFPEACFLISVSPPWDIINNLLHNLQNALELLWGSCFNHACFTNHSFWKIHILLTFLWKGHVVL